MSSTLLPSKKMDLGKYHSYSKERHYWFCSHVMNLSLYNVARLRLVYSQVAKPPPLVLTTVRTAAVRRGSLALITTPHQIISNFRSN